MEMTKDINITSAEWRIMRVVWTLDAVTSRELTDILGESMDWKPATIKTLLRRLVDKGILQTTKDGQKFVYTSVMKESDTIDLATKEFFDQLCARKVGRAIADLVDSSRLTQDDIDGIRSALDEKQAVKEIECNCLPDDCSC